MNQLLTFFVGVYAIGAVKIFISALSKEGASQIDDCRSKTSGKLLDCLGIFFLVAVDYVYITQPMEKIAAVKTAAAYPIEITFGTKGRQCGEYRDYASLAQVFYSTGIKLGETLKRCVGEVIPVGSGSHLCPIKIAIIAAVTIITAPQSGFFSTVRRNIPRPFSRVQPKRE